jgi:hypothetical protein
VADRVGLGGATISFSVTESTNSTPREGTITVAGQTFTVAQFGTACSLLVTPSGVSATYALTRECR